MYVGNSNSKHSQDNGIYYETVYAIDSDVLKCIEFVDEFKLSRDNKESAYKAVNFVNDKRMNSAWTDFLFSDFYDVDLKLTKMMKSVSGDMDPIQVRKNPPTFLPRLQQYSHYFNLFYSKLGAAYYTIDDNSKAIKCFRMSGIEFKDEEINAVAEKVFNEMKTREAEKEIEKRKQEEYERKIRAAVAEMEMEEERREKEEYEKDKIKAEFREFWNTKLFVVDDTLRLKNIYRLLYLGKRLEKTDFFRSCEYMTRSNFYRKLGTACEILTYKHKAFVLHLGNSGPTLIRENRAEVPTRKNDEEKNGMTENDWEELTLFCEKNLVQESSESKNQAIALLKTNIKGIELNSKKLLELCNAKGENLKLLVEIVVLYDKFITSELSQNNACDLAILGNNLIETNFFENLSNEEKRYIYAKLGEAYYKMDEFDRACLHFNKSELLRSRKPIVNKDNKIVYDHNNEIFICSKDINNPRIARIKKMYEYAYHKDELLKEEIDETYDLTVEEFLSLYSKFFKLDLSCGNIENAQEAIKLASLFIDTPIFHKRSNQLIENCYTKLSKAYYNIGNFGSALVFLRKNKKVYDYCEGRNDVSFDTLNNEEREAAIMYGICCTKLLYEKDEEMEESELNTYLQAEKDLETLKTLTKLEATNGVLK